MSLLLPNIRIPCFVISLLTAARFLKSANFIQGVFCESFFSCNCKLSIEFVSGIISSATFFGEEFSLSFSELETLRSFENASNLVTLEQLEESLSFDKASLK